MAFERHNGAEEFETMLRHHLIRSAGQSPTCAGFDAEKANAYLEGALSQFARSRYDEHLVGCASCRRAIIELRRLIPEVDLAPVSVQSPNRFAEWWSGIRQGFALPRWSPLGWGMTAAAGALAILLTVVLILRQRQESADMPNAVAQVSTPQPNSTPAAAGIASDVAQPGQPTDARNRQVAVHSTAPQATPINGRIPVDPVRPAVPVAPQVMMAAAPNQNSISGRVNGPAGAAIAEAQIALVEVGSQQQRALTRTDENGKFNFSEVPHGNYQLNIQAAGFLPLQLADIRPEPSREVVARLHAKPMMDQSLIAAVQVPTPAPAPPPAPVQVTEKDEKAADNENAAPRRPEAATGRGAAVATNTGDKGSAKSSGRRFGFIPSIRPKKDKDKEEKSSADAAAKAGDDETVRVMKHKVRDKVFRFESGSDGGRWVDQEFKPEFLPKRIRLTRGSAEYERVLTEIPDLQPFFDLGRVLVIWKGTVYEIR
jgi:hypothetical protein